VVALNRHWRVNHAKHKHIAADVVPRVFKGQPSYELVQCSLGRLVGNQGIRTDGCDAANVGDTAGLLGPHDRQCVLADQHGSIEIDIEDVIPSAPLNLDRITVQTPNTDIVVKNVDAAEL
jgi:hypothetical protein